jgi:hypothetical protein
MLVKFGGRQWWYGGGYMPIAFNPTPHGGRVVIGDTPYGKFQIEWDADGQLVSESCTIKTPNTPAATPCTHLGSPTGESVKCPSCRGTVKVKIHTCQAHGTCTPIKRVPGYTCCTSCQDYDPS